MLDAEQWEVIWTKIRGLWRDWEPTNDESQIWRKRLSRYSLYNIREAVDEMYIDRGKFKKPDIGSLIKTIKAYRAEASKQNPITLPEGNAWLVCTALDDNSEGIIGQYQWLGWWHSPAVPMHSSHYTKDAIEEVTSLYGGIWTPFCCLGQEIMLKIQELKRGAIVIPNSDIPF